VLSEADAVKAAEKVLAVQDAERFQLDILRRYATGHQALPLVVPRDAPAEVREMARMSRINIIRIVVDSLVQSLFVDNMRVPRAAVDDEGAPIGEPDDVTHEVWRAWQANRMDRGQSGLYRAVFQYGWAYMVVTAGSPTPVMTTVSPRRMTAMYADGSDWPELALQRGRRPGTYRLYDPKFVYTMGYDAERKAWTVIGSPAEHGSPYCPVIRYQDVEDLDLDDEPVSHLSPGGIGARDNVVDMVAGQVVPLMALQDQMDLTTFGLKSAEWYSAFRQRWIVGWTPASATDKVKAASSQMWTFDNDPDEVKLGEFSETTLQGYLSSRDSTAKFAATLSQTPVHELIGELVNLSAEALAAAEAGRDRKVDERKTGLGESHEQTASCVGALMGVDVPDDFEVVWRDTSARAFGAIVDGLGKLAAQLEIPPEALWEKIPGTTMQEIRGWKALRAEGDAMGQLTGLLDKQAAVPPPAPGTTGSGIILPPGVRA
jgi:hypothetical protein